MDCRQAESLLALWVGHDLDDLEPARQVQDHLEECDHCRARSREFVVAHTALQEARRVPPEGASSLWPRVRARLVEWERRPQFAKFNVWVPTALATVACSLMVWVTSVEVQRKMQQPQARNLYVSDPQFASGRFRELSRRDLERWQQLEFVPLQSVGAPSRMGEPEY